MCCFYSAAPEILLSVEADDNDTVWCGTIDGKLLCFDMNGFSTIDLWNPVSTNEFDKQNSLFKIFPNPVNNALYINFIDTGEKYIQANIYDLNGKLMIKFPEQLIEHNLSHLQLNLNNQLKSSGVYVLSVNFGSKIYSEKFLFKK